MDRDDLTDKVNHWAEEYVGEIGGNASDFHKQLLRTAFRSGCFRAIMEFAKQEVSELVEHHMKKK